jgi:3-methyl-2-oxobutanoate hydroxymethyltransferase
MEKNKLSVAGLRAAKGTGRRLKMVTAYDYPSAVLVDRSAVDIILVGDSLGNNVLGYDGTTQVTMEEVLHHLHPVARGAPHTMIVADMPFGSYNASPEQAIQNANRFMKAGADCIKLEGGTAFAETVRALVRAGVPVMGHTGLMPQTVHPSAWKVQGRDAPSARRIIGDAMALEEAGVCSLVLESVPARLAAHITAQVTVPTIGIAAGPACDGQVLIWHDMLGLHNQHLRHVKRYANLGDVIVGALERYCADVDAGDFPTDEHSFKMKVEELVAAVRDMQEGEGRVNLL